MIDFQNNDDKFVMLFAVEPTYKGTILRAIAVVK